MSFDLSEQKCDYELYAIVDHFGSLRGGHYTAKIKSFEDYNWYEFNDSYVTKVCEIILFISLNTAYTIIFLIS